MTPIFKSLFKTARPPKPASAPPILEHDGQTAALKEVVESRAALVAALKVKFPGLPF